MSSELIKRLLEERANVWEQAKEHLDAVEAEGRDESGEHKETWDKLNARMGEIDERVKELDDVEKRNAAAAEMRDRYKAAAPAEKAKQDDDNAILRKMVAGEIRGYEFRDLSKLSAGAGANTVPTSFYGQLQQHLIENSTLRQSNVTVLTTDSGEALQVPKTTTHPTAALIAEAGSITESDAVFGMVTLDAFKYAFSTQVSAELEQDTGVDLMGYLAERGGIALANGSGAHFVTGTGSSQPNGIVTASTLGVTGGSGVTGAFTVNDIIDLYYSVIDPYRRNGTWLMADAAIKAARKLKDATSGFYLWNNSVLADEPSTLLGRPVLNDTNIVDPALSAKSVLFGDFSKYFIRDVRGVRVERSTEFAFQNDLVTWRFILRTDGDLVDTTGAVKHFIGNAA